MTSEQWKISETLPSFQCYNIANYYANYSKANANIFLHFSG